MSTKSVWQEALIPFVISRLLIIVITYIAISRFAVSKFPLKGEVAPHDCIHGVKYCLYIWQQWDATLYIKIAHNGYSDVVNTAFFPLWPFLMHCLGFLLGGSITADYFAGVILSNAFFYLALVVLYKLVVIHFDRLTARNTLFFITFSPYALFFFAPYTESLFLLLSLSVFFLLYSDKIFYWWLAGCCGYLAALTRSTGIVLCLPFLFLALSRFGVFTLFHKTDWDRKLHLFLSMLLVPAGLLTYMLYLQISKGNALMFVTQEALIWHRYSTIPIMGIIKTVQALFVPAYQSELNLVDFAFTLIPIVILITGWKCIPRAYGFFSLAMMLFSLSNPYTAKAPLTSAPRYLLVVFPLFIILALWAKKNQVNTIILAVSMVFFTFNIILFITSNWVA